MRWSQLKIQMESFFADSVKGRVELHVTRYHKAPDQYGCAWITIDKKEILDCSDMGFEFNWARENHSRLQISPDEDNYKVWRRPDYLTIVNGVRDDLHQRGIISLGDFTYTIECYLNTPIEQILTTPNSLARALGMLDRRVGKSRLEKISMDGQPQIVRQLYEFRCQAEGINSIARKLSLFWDSHTQGALFGHELRVRKPELWFRIHALPESKRYPENEAEYQEILHRHNTILTDLFGVGTNTLLLLPLITFENNRPKKLTFPVDPGDLFWRTRPLAIDDPNTSYAHFYIRSLTWEKNILNDLLRQIAKGKLAYIMIVNPETHLIYAPYDGGSDVIADNQSQRDILKTQFSNWQPKSPNGL